MATKIYDVTRGYKVDVAPKIYHGGQFKPTASWVFKEGLWRKSYDPREINLIANSRMLGGTDIFSQDNEIIGHAPPTWTISNNARINSSAIYTHDETEYSRKYTLNVINGSIHMNTRISCVKDQIYYASFLVDDIETIPTRNFARLFVEGISFDDQIDFIEIIEPFDRIDETNRIGCQFLIKQDCVLSYSIGVGINNTDTGTITFSEPQINRNPFYVQYAPTPVHIDYHSIDFDGGFISTETTLFGKNGYSWIDYSLSIKKPQILVLTSRYNVDGSYSGIQINMLNNTIEFIDNSFVFHVENLSKSVPVNQLIRLTAQITVSSDYVSKVRLLINNTPIVEVNELILGLRNNFNRVLGNETNLSEIVLEQFNFYFNDKTYTFNIEEGENDIINDRSGQLSFNLGGIFNWLDERSP